MGWNAIGPGCITMALAALTSTGCEEPAELKLTTKDNDRRIELTPGQAFRIALESNPSTGFQWQIVEFDEVLLQSTAESKYESSDPNGPPGTAGQQVFRFATRKAGQTTICMVYRRPWEKDQPPVRSYSLTLLIR